MYVYSVLCGVIHLSGMSHGCAMASANAIGLKCKVLVMEVESGERLASATTTILPRSGLARVTRATTFEAMLDYDSLDEC